MTNTAIAPRWLTVKQASIYSGIGTRSLQNYIKDGHLRSSNAAAPGKAYGRRLIEKESLDTFIERGVGVTPSIKMNEGREGRAK
jgi:hypothetical protein